MKHVIASGLDPSIGLLQSVYEGEFPLAYDLMEPFYELADLPVLSILYQIKPKNFERNAVHYLKLKRHTTRLLLRSMQNIFDAYVDFNGQRWCIENIISAYVMSLCQALNKHQLPVFHPFALPPTPRFIASEESKPSLLEVYNQVCG
jgi:CRISPR associated protein Cas1